MKNKKLKAMALLTASAMLVTSCLTGCGKTEEPASSPESKVEESKAEEPKPEESQAEEPEELEPVELKWLLRIPEQPDGDMVLEELNKILKEKINATLDIQWIDPVAYPEKTKLMITSGEEFDIMFTSSGYGFYDYASKGAYLPLNELLEKYAPKTFEQIPDGFWGATTINGSIYGIPNYQIAARQPAITYRKETLEKYDLDVSNIKTIEDMESVLKTVKENETDMQFIMGPPYVGMMDTLTYLGLEGIGADGIPGCIEIDGSELKVLNQYEHPAVVNLLKTLKEYEKAGYINKDGALIEDFTEINKNGDGFAGAFSTYKPGVEVEMITRYGYESEFVKVCEPYLTTSSILGTLQAVSKTSKNPERAVMFLELVNTDPEIYNMIVYGLEGKHYTKNDDNTITKITDSGYNTNVPWMIGNTFNGYLQEGQDPELYAQTQKLNEESRVSRIMGFQFNPEPVKTEISQCSTVYEKYYKGLAYGLYDDVEATLADMNKEFKAAGMDAVIAEKQAQLDAWAAAK